MTANPFMVEERGIDMDRVRTINWLHIVSDNAIKEAIKGNVPEEEVEEFLKNTEFTLQDLWNFPFDESFHMYFKSYQFKKLWWGRTFMEKDSGAEFTIPFTCHEGAFYTIGHGFIDLGRMGKDGDSLYYRCTPTLVELERKFI